ncbi:MAG: acyltransferase family protein [Gammaproteobacteria bacterium]
MRTEDQSEKYAPQLDGVRALAIGIVLLQHYLPSYARFVPSGEIGVRIFFVLSGFLITRISLGVRERSALVDQPLKLSLRQFYLRRALRIFPVYYVGVAAGIAGGLLPYPDAMPWVLTYISNWYTVSES